MIFDILQYCDLIIFSLYRYYLRFINDEGDLASGTSDLYLSEAEIMEDMYLNT